MGPNFSFQFALSKEPDQFLDPLGISSLKCWLDPNRGVSDTAAAVDSWVDQSGNGNNATGVTSNRPTLIPSSSGIAGNRIITFTAASSHYLSVNGLSSIFTGSDAPWSVILVFKKTGNTGTQVMFCASRSSSTTPVHELYTNAESNYSYFRRPDSGGSATANGTKTPDLLAHVISWVFTGTTISSWIDGTIDLNASACDVTALTTDRVSIGVWNSTSLLQPWNGSVGDVFVFNKALSDIERKTIERFCKGKYGIA